MNLSELTQEHRKTKEALNILKASQKHERVALQKKLYALSSHISAIESRERRKKTKISV